MKTATALLSLVTLIAACAPAQETATQAAPERFGFGRPANTEEIAALDIDIMPDGTGLPPGSGSAIDGERVYAARCAACHGPTATEGPWPELAGEPVPDFGFGDDPSLLGKRVIGNYWPYATTVFDYIRRSMPQDRPGSLSDHEVYAVTAWLLWRNQIVERDAVLDAATLPAIRMPARDRFVPDSATRR
jgi:cytochrome c